MAFSHQKNLKRIVEISVRTNDERLMCANVFASASFRIVNCQLSFCERGKFGIELEWRWWSSICFCIRSWHPPNSERHSALQTYYTNFVSLSIAHDSLHTSDWKNGEWRMMNADLIRMHFKQRHWLPLRMLCLFCHRISYVLVKIRNRKKCVKLLPQDSNEFPFRNTHRVNCAAEKVKAPTKHDSIQSENKNEIFITSKSFNPKQCVC